MSKGTGLYWKVKVVSDSWWPQGLYSPWNSPGQNTRVGSHSSLQGIFPTQGSKPGLPNFRQILYQLSHKGSPRILEWVAYPLSKGSSQPRNRTGVSCIAGGFFTNWAIREALAYIGVNKYWFTGIWIFISSVQIPSFPFAKRTSSYSPENNVTGLLNFSEIKVWFTTEA